MIKLLLIGYMGVFMLGCSTKIPAITEYRVDTESLPQAFSVHGCKNKSLKIAQAFSPSFLMTLTMNYGLGNYKQYSFTQSQWAESPNRAITAEILEYIRLTKLFKSVQISKSRSKSGLLLETNIEDFMQYFSEDEKESFVHVSITFSLIDVKENSVVATNTFKSKINVDELSADAGVKYLNMALENVLHDSGIWLSEVCK